jgi:UDP-N-acetylmuramyl tripeptide synthase
MTDDAILTDSRRLPGPNRLFDRPGAVVDVVLPEAHAEAIIEAWRRRIVEVLGAVGWEGEEVRALRFPGGASLAFTAPVDSLYAATEVNEWAWAAALTDATAVPAPPALAEAARDLRAKIVAERNPALLALLDAARDHRVACVRDDRIVSVGLGTGSRSFPADALPDPASLDWSRIHDVPTALVTGLNGKTTTVRLIAAMARADGRRTGWSCTEGVYVDGESLGTGDFSGPEGARMVVRDSRVEAAVLETARGGMLRRGLAIEHAQVAVVTNIAADHFGEFGVHDLAALTEAKLVVAKAIGPAGRVVLNADDPHLVEAAATLRAPLAWFGFDPSGEVLSRAASVGLPVATLQGETLVLRQGNETTALLPLDEIPLAMGGVARHNVANALAASVAAWCLGLSPEAIRGALRSFGIRVGENLGRGNLFDYRGARILLDYAHNPHGMDALAALSRHLSAARRLVLIGQAGDRDDDAIRALARSACAVQPDRVIIKEMASYLRGRPEGQIPALMREEFELAGIPAAAITVSQGELAGVREALAWAREGDLLVLTVHAERPAVLELLAAEGAVDAGLPSVR